MVSLYDRYSRLGPGAEPPEEDLPMIRDLDFVLFRKNNRVTSPVPGLEDLVALMALHKIRYEWTKIDDGLRLASGRWLRTEGYGRFLVGDILPNDMLPLPWPDGYTEPPR